MSQAGAEEAFWVETVDENTGNPYFYHSVTLETCWERPAGIVVPESELDDPSDEEPDPLHAAAGIVTDTATATATAIVPTTTATAGDAQAIPVALEPVVAPGEPRVGSAAAPPAALSSSAAPPALPPVLPPPSFPAPPPLPGPPAADADSVESLRIQLTVANARIAELEHAEAALATAKERIQALETELQDTKAKLEREREKHRSMSTSALDTHAHKSPVGMSSFSMRNIHAPSAGAGGSPDSSSRATSTPTSATASAPGHRSVSTQLSFLKSVPLFHSFTEAQFAQLCQSLVSESFNEGDIIIQRGDVGDKFYVIESGKIAVHKPDTKAAGAGGNTTPVSVAASVGTRTSSVGSMSEEDGMDEILDEDVDSFEALHGPVVAELSAGFFFGEAALMNDTPRTATCVAISPVTCFVLNRDSFSSVLSQVEHLLTNASRGYDHNESVEALCFARHVNSFHSVLQVARGNVPGAVTDVVVSRDIPAFDLPVTLGLLRIIASIPPELGIASLLDGIAKEALQLLNVSECRMLLFDDAAHQFLVRKAEGFIRIPASEAGVSYYVAATGTPIVSQDTTADSRFDLESAASDASAASADGASSSWGPGQDAVDIVLGSKTSNLIAIAVRGRDKLPYAVLQFTNKVGFDSSRPSDEDVTAFTPEPVVGRFSLRDHALAVGLAEALGTALEERVQEFEIALGGAKASKHLALHSVSQTFRVLICGARRLAIPKKKNVTVHVQVSLYHGHQLLCSSADTDPAPFSVEADSDSGSSMWQQRVIMGIKFCDLPVATRLICNVYTRDGPLGWAGCNLFTSQRVLKTGSVVLKMWPGECTQEMAGVVTSMNNRHGEDSTTGELIVSLHQFKRTVVNVDTKDYESEDMSEYARSQFSEAEFDAASDELAALVRKDPLYELTEAERELVWKAREFLVDTPDALPGFLQSVRWEDGACVSQAHTLLKRWHRPSPLHALQLLDVKFPDPTVRAYAVSCLEYLSNKDLRQYMLQLSQVIKFEPFLDSALARFLLRRALMMPRSLGHVLFWYLQAEMHIPDARDRYGTLLEQYLRNCGDHRSELGHQMFVMSRLEAIAMKVKAVSGKEERRALLKTELPQIVFPQSFQLPLSPDMQASGLNTDPMQCRVMSSKKLPLWLSFKGSPDPSKSIVVLFKAGDDLRQDQLTLQILQIMDNLWKAQGLDLRMSPYGCVSTGDELGMLEVVLNAATLAEIVVDSVSSSSKKGLGHKFRVAKNVLRDDVIHRWLLRQPGNEGNMEAVYDNFSRSVAGYCVATYVLGIGDRHNDNIMLTRDGRLFHIDFGHFLGNFKSKMGYKRERAPFIFTPHFSDVLGGPGSDRFEQFEEYCVQAYNALRRQGNLLITLFFLMLSCGIPELTKPSDLDWLKDKLMIGATDEEAGAMFRKQILASLHTKTTLFNDIFHLLKHA